MGKGFPSSIHVNNGVFVVKSHHHRRDDLLPQSCAEAAAAQSTAREELASFLAVPAKLDSLSLRLGFRHDGRSHKSSGDKTAFQTNEKLLLRRSFALVPVG